MYEDINFKTNYLSGPLLGIYRGLVLDNRDPAFENGFFKGEIKVGCRYGRVKVYIPLLMDPDKIKSKTEKEEGSNQEDTGQGLNSEDGIWALPANNLVGGRNHNQISKKVGQHKYQKYYGTCMIPTIGSYVFVFFEGGDPNRPFYFGACDLVEEEVPPENRVGTQWELKWTLYRSQEGRAIIVSDDLDDERTEITGKKRIEPEKVSEHVYKIETNQKTVLIDDRPFCEKILIKDQNGNYINIFTKENKLHIFFHDEIHVHTEKSMYFKADEDIHFRSKNMYIETENDYHLMIHNDRHESILKDDNLTVCGSKHTMINESEDRNIKENYLFKAKNVDVKVENNIDIKNENMTIETMMLNIKAKIGIAIQIFKDFLIQTGKALSMKIGKAWLIDYSSKAENEGKSIPVNINDLEIDDPEKVDFAERSKLAQPTGKRNCDDDKEKVEEDEIKDCEETPPPPPEPEPEPEPPPPPPPPPPPSDDDEDEGSSWKNNPNSHTYGYGSGNI